MRLIINNNIIFVYFDLILHYNKKFPTKIVKAYSYSRQLNTRNREQCNNHKGILTNTEIQIRWWQEVHRCNFSWLRPLWRQLRSWSLAGPATEVWFQLFLMYDTEWFVYIPHSGANDLSCWSTLKQQLSLALSCPLICCGPRYLTSYLAMIKSFTV